MIRLSTIILALSMPQGAMSGEPITMQPFNMEMLEIEDDWSSKEVGYKDSELITFFRKNLGASAISGHPDLESLVYFTISYEPATPQGFPSKDDYESITTFEDVDVPRIEIESNSIHVASVLKNGIKDFLFYVSDPEEFLRVVNRNNSRIKALKIKMELVRDPKWEIYADFP